VENPKIETVRDKSVLLSLLIRRPNMTRRGDIDKITSEADKDNLTLSKRIIKSPEFRAVTGYAIKLRQELDKLCLPSPIGRGTYIVPVVLLDRVSEVLKDAQNIYRGLVEEFLAVYPEQREQARYDLKDQYDPDNYLEPEELRKRFSVNYHLLDLNIPDPSKIGEVAWEAESKRAEAIWANAEKEIQYAMRESFRGLVSHLADRLKVEPDGTKRKFKDVTVENLEEFFETFRQRNLTNDQDLLNLVGSARKILKGVNPEDLRKQDDIRESVKEKMDTIKSKLDSLLVDAPARQIDFD
jgi:hypothetical protein